MRLLGALCRLSMVMLYLSFCSCRVVVSLLRSVLIIIIFMRGSFGLCFILYDCFGGVSVLFF